MARGIIIFGPAGSGKTTLGKRVAEKLKYPYFDIDDYIWKMDVEKPFSVMYSRTEKIDRLMNDISKGDNFVMAGSMDSFNAPFVPLFDLAVHITASVEVRIQRIHKREYEIFGNRILIGGDLYEEHKQFLNNSAKYDEDDASPSMKVHETWAKILPCKVIKISGEAALENSTKLIVNEYLKEMYLKKTDNQL